MRDHLGGPHRATACRQRRLPLLWIYGAQDDPLARGPHDVHLRISAPPSLADHVSTSSSSVGLTRDLWNIFTVSISFAVRPRSESRGRSACLPRDQDLDVVHRTPHLEIVATAGDQTSAERRLRRVVDALCSSTPRGDGFPTTPRADFFDGSSERISSPRSPSRRASCYRERRLATRLPAESQPLRGRLRASTIGTSRAAPRWDNPPGLMLRSLRRHVRGRCLPCRRQHGRRA